MIQAFQYIYILLFMIKPCNCSTISILDELSIKFKIVRADNYTTLVFNLVVVLDIASTLYIREVIIRTFF